MSLIGLEESNGRLRKVRPLGEQSTELVVLELFQAPAPKLNDLQVQDKVRQPLLPRYQPCASQLKQLSTPVPEGRWAMRCIASNNSTFVEALICETTKGC